MTRAPSRHTHRTAGSHPRSGRRLSKIAVMLAMAGGMTILAGGVAHAYFETTDNSHPAAALAATLTAPTGGTQNGTATPSAVPIGWTAPSGYAPTGYTVLRCTGAACTPSSSPAVGGCSNIVTSAVTANGCIDTDTALTAGTTYTYVVEALLDNWTSPVSAPFTASTAAASRLVFTTQPSPGQNIQATGTGTFSASVAVQDQNGNTVTGDSGRPVTLAIGTNPSGGVLTCTGTGLTVSDSSGVANFTGCAITLAGTGYKLTASSAALAAPSNANAFNIVAGAASRLSFTTQPSPGQNIQATGTGTFSASVAVQDQNGNTVTGDSGRPVALAIGTNPSGGVLSCTGSGLTVSDSSGVANFTGCAITLAGTGYKLTASSAALAAPSNANAFNITAGAPDYLGFTGITVPLTGATSATCMPNPAAHTNACTISNIVAILSYTASVALFDQNGNLAPASSTVTVSLSSSALSSVSRGSVTIASGTSTSSATFTETLGLGVGTVTASTSVSSVPFQSTITPGL